MVATLGDLKNKEVGKCLEINNTSADSLIGRAPDYESEDPSSTLGWRSKILFVYLWTVKCLGGGMVDALVLGTSALTACGFESHPRYKK